MAFPKYVHLIGLIFFFTFQFQRIGVSEKRTEEIISLLESKGFKKEEKTEEPPPPDRGL